MATFDLSQFVPPIESGTEIQNAGSVLLVGPLLEAENGETGPTCYTIEVDQGVAPAPGDTTLDVVVLAPATEVFLRAGTYLHFPAGPVVLAADATVTTTATTLSVDPIVDAPADDDQAMTWGLRQILSPTNLPLTYTDQFVDRKDLTFGLQGSEVQVSFMANLNITVIARVDDVAYFNTIYRAGTSNARVYAMLIRSSGETCIGACHVSAPSADGPINEIERPTFNLNYQAPFWAATIYSQLTPTEQTGMNEARRLAGLPELT